MKRVNVVLTVTATNNDDPKDTTSTTLRYGDMSFDSFQVMERAVSSTLFALGDAAKAQKHD